MKKKQLLAPTARVVHATVPQDQKDKAESRNAEKQQRNKFLDDDEPRAGDTEIDREESRVADAKAAKPSLPGLARDAEADKRLRSFIERVERLNTEVSELQEDIKEIYGEAKVNGYDPKIMRKIVRMRKMDVEKRREEESLIEVYKTAIGMD